MATSSDSAAATEPAKPTERAFVIPQNDAARATLIQNAKRIFNGEKIDDPNAIAAVEQWKKKAYLKEFPEDIDEFRTLLQDYSKVPPDQVEPLLRDIRERAWVITPYPCIGHWTFISLKQNRTPRAREALARLVRPESSDTLLDLACCVGQFNRKLVSQGVAPDKLYATDLQAEYLELGFELFRDRDRWPADHFVAGNMLEPTEEEKAGGSLALLDGKITLIHAANFFHLFDWDKQVAAGTRLVRFLKPDAKDVFIFGGQIGTLTPTSREESNKNPFGRFLHDQKTFQEMWDEIGEKTGTKWRVDVEMLDKSPFPKWEGEAAKYFLFGIYRL